MSSVYLDTSKHGQDPLLHEILKRYGFTFTGTPMGGLGGIGGIGGIGGTQDIFNSLGVGGVAGVGPGVTSVQVSGVAIFIFFWSKS